MILADTSIWIDHLHKADPTLVACLERATVCVHTMVIGELALGSLRDRSHILGLLGNLTSLPEADHHEVMLMVQNEGLYGQGLSLIDAHLLAAVRLSPGTRIWTRDQRLDAVATKLGLSWTQS